MTSLSLPASILQMFNDWQRKPGRPSASLFKAADLSKAVRTFCVERFFTLQHHDAVLVSESEA